MNASDLKIPKHKCITLNQANSRCSFCRNCGIHMSKMSPNTKYYRSSKYNVVYLYRMDGNLVLPELIKKQSQNRIYNPNSNHLSYRAELIAFIEEIALKLDYSEATYHLAISMIDALLSMYTIDEKQIKMVCFMALNIAAKMYENNKKIPELTAIAQLFENQFDIEEIATCEIMFSKVLGYNIRIKTPETFVQHFLSVGVVNEEDIGQLPSDLIEEKMCQFDKLVSFFLQTSVNHYAFYSFTSIAVATAAIACARKLMGFTNVWTDELENLTSISMDSIEMCTKMLYEAAEENYPVLTPKNILGTPVEVFECPPILSGFKTRGSIFTEASSEKDENNFDLPQVSEFSLFDSDEEEIDTTTKFVVPFDFNC